MGQINDPSPVLLILAAFSQSEEALDWAARQAEAIWGPVALASERFEFVETAYYEPTMGASLRKQFLAFERLVDPAELPSIKRLTNKWEEEYAAAPGEKPRPLNLDPGYLTLAKLVLASTKDHSHRIYLCEGIYAEVTLVYKDRRWQPREWTFPDYRREDYREFFDRCRLCLKARQT